VFHMCQSHCAHLDRTLQPPDLPHLLAETESTVQDTRVCSLQSKYIPQSYVEDARLTIFRPKHRS
jgi:hypothetical protein